MRGEAALRRLPAYASETHRRERSRSASELRAITTMQLPPIPLMTADKARDVGRSYKALADHLTEFGLPRQAAAAMRDSQWWLAYSIALAQTDKSG